MQRKIFSSSMALVLAFMFFLSLAAVTPALSAEKININTADEAALVTLTGIGPAKAQKIIEYRKDNPFEKIEDIMKVSGIGEATFDKIKDKIVVE